MASQNASVQNSLPDKPIKRRSSEYTEFKCKRLKLSCDFAEELEKKSQQEASRLEEEISRNAVPLENKFCDKKCDQRRNCVCENQCNKLPESDEDLEKFFREKLHSCCEGSCLGAFELDMRKRLAELHRKYKEKQKELNKLQKEQEHLGTNKDEKIKKKEKKLKKKGISDNTSPPPPPLNKVDSIVKLGRETPELKPLILHSFGTSDIEIRSANPQHTEFSQREELLQKNDNLQKNSFSQRIEFSERNDSPHGCSSPSLDSRKKRKVGRPKKIESPSGKHIGTETIVAKKGSLVGYLLAAKEKFLQSKTYSNSPPRYIEDSIKKHKSHKKKRAKNLSRIKQKLEEKKKKKIRPKLKAEPTLKIFDDEENEWQIEEGDCVVDTEEIMEDDIYDEVSQETPEDIHEENFEEPTKMEQENCDDEVENKCLLTERNIDIDNLRVLTAMGGLFYAGQLNAIESPDVYSITLDGERGNRPHILSREDTLRDAVS